MMDFLSNLNSNKQKTQNMLYTHYFLIIISCKEHSVIFTIRKLGFSEPPTVLPKRQDYEIKEFLIWFERTNMRRSGGARERDGHHKTRGDQLLL